MINPLKWWRIKRWRAVDHEDCMMFMGPCNLCRERLEYLGLNPNPKPFYEWKAAGSPPTPAKPAPLPKARALGSKSLRQKTISRFRLWSNKALGERPEDILESFDGHLWQCDECQKIGHCKHVCQNHYWCHDCDGPECGGGCYDDKTCPKRMHVIESGRPGWELYPDEWPDGPNKWCIHEPKHQAEK